MLSISNATRFAATVVPASDPEGADVLLAVAKATYRIVRGTRLELADEQRPLVPVDEYAGEPGRSALLSASDFAVGKPGADVVLLGHACAPAGRSVTEVDVSISVGRVSTRLRVFGDRSWKRALLGLSASRPESFRRMPLSWDRCFGGTCPAEGKGVGEDRCERNPIGAGWWRNEKDAVDRPLPNIEDPAALVKSWKDKPDPVGCGFVPGDWLPRRELGGTYDAAWERERMPLLPSDFDPRWWQCAAPALQASEPFAGGEPVRVGGVHPDGDLAFELPRDRVTCDVLLPAERLTTHALALDTLVLMPDDLLLCCTYRAVVPAPQPITSVLAACVRSALHPAPSEVAAGGGRG